MCDFFWQGLTGGDGHQQRTDYVISTKATPGRYMRRISTAYSPYQALIPDTGLLWIMEGGWGGGNLACE